MNHQNISNFSPSKFDPSILNDSAQNLSVHDCSFQGFDPNISLDLPPNFGNPVPLTETELHMINSENNFNNVSILSIPVEVDNLLFSNQVQMHTLQPLYQPHMLKADQYLQPQQLPPNQLLHNDEQMFQQTVEQLTNTQEPCKSKKVSQPKKPRKRTDKADKRTDKVDKNVICGVCGKWYVSLQSLARHTQKMHKDTNTNTNTNLNPTQEEESPVDERSRVWKGPPEDFTFGGSPKRRHPCMDCGHAFSSVYVLKMHQKNYHKNNERAPCDFCQATVYVMEIPAHFMAKHVHVNNHKDVVNKFTCAICSKGYKKRKDIQKHVSVHSSIRPWKCDFCIQAFQSYAYLSEHLRTHAVKSIKCRYCDKVFKTHSVRSKHEKTIHNGDRSHLIKKYQCDKCEKSFTNEAKLKNHAFSHLGVKPHKCYICADKRYAHERDLKNHMKRYHPEFKVIKRKNEEPLLIGPEDQPWALVTVSRNRKNAASDPAKPGPSRQKITKPYKCSYGYCSARFSTAKKHELHARIHKRELSSYAPCKVCKKKIEESHHMPHFLNDHVTVDEEVTKGKTTSKTYSCDVCPYKCSMKRYMQKHSVNHLDVRPWECTTCKATFTLLDYLVNHEKIHQAAKLPCRTCFKLFSTHTTRSRHERVVHQGRAIQKNFECPICKKAFPTRCKVKIHMAKHTGEKKFKCKFCKKREYSYRDDLLKHMRRDHKGPVQVFKKSAPCPNAPVGFTARTDEPQYTAPSDQLTQMTPLTPAAAQESGPSQYQTLVTSSGPSPHVDILLEAAQANNLVPLTFTQSDHKTVTSL